MPINRWGLTSTVALIVGLALPAAAAAQGSGVLHVTAQVVTDRAPAASQLEVARLAARTADLQPGRQLRTSTDLSQLKASRRPTGVSEPQRGDLVQVRVNYLAN